MENILNFIGNLYSINPFLTIFAIILSEIIFSLLVIPATPLTLLSGVILGTPLGAVVAWAGHTLGATLAFLVSRYVFREYVERKFLPKYPKIKEYDELFFKDGFKTVLVLRFIPLFPFNVLNYALGVTRVSFRDYFFGTTIGIMPATFAFVYLGESLVSNSWYKILTGLVMVGALVYLSRKLKLHK